MRRSRARERLIDKIDEVLAWTTWAQISTAVEDALPRLSIDEPSVRASIERQATALVEAIAWHAH